MGYIIRYLAGGIWYDISNAVFLEKTEELNCYEECTVSFPNTAENRTLVSTPQRIKVIYNNTTIFDGRFTTVNYKKDFIEFTGYTPAFSKLKRAIFNGDYSDGIPLNTLLGYVCSQGGVTAVCSKTDTIKANYKYQYCWDIITSLASIANCDFWSYYGSNTSISDIRLEFGTKGTAYPEVDVVGINECTKDSTDKITKVIGVGTDSEGNEIVVEVGSGTESVYVFYESDVTNQAILTSKANKLLNEYSKEYTSSKIQVRVDSGYNLKAGDTIYISDTELGLSGYYRIYKLKMTPRIIEVDIEKVTLAIRNAVNTLRGVRSIIISASGKPIPDTTPDIPTFTAVADEIDTATEFKTWIAISINRVNKASGYVVEYCRCNNEGIPLGNPQYIEVPQTDDDHVTVYTPNLLPSQYYYVRVASKSLKGVIGDYSAKEIVLTTSNNTPPPAPTGVTVTAIMGGLWIKWDASTAEDFDRYGVFIGTSPDMLLEITSTKSTYYEFAVTSSSWYRLLYVAIKAYDVAGNSSAFSSIVTATPLYVNSYDLSIESRPWSAKFRMWEDSSVKGKLYWDDGSGGNPSIKFADGTTKTFNKNTSGTTYGQEVRYFYYLNGNSTLQSSTTYSDAVGSGKCFLAVANIKTAEGERTTIWTFNSYSPTIGTGVLAAGIIEASHIKSNAIQTDHLAASVVTSDKISSNAIQTNHLSAGVVTSDKISSNAIQTNHLTAGVVTSDKITSNLIYGKDFATAQNVGQSGGPAGVRFNSSGIAGYTGGTNKSFEIVASTGVTKLAGGSFIADNYRSAFIDPSYGDQTQISNYVAQWKTGGGGDLYNHFSLLPVSAIRDSVAQFGHSYVVPEPEFCVDQYGYGYLGTPTQYTYWKYIYGYYVRYKDIASFESLDDLAILKSIKEKETKDEKGKIKKVIDKNDIKHLLSDDDFGENDFFDAGKVSGFALCVSKKLLERIEELEKKIAELEDKVTKTQ